MTNKNLPKCPEQRFFESWLKWIIKELSELDDEDREKVNEFVSDLYFNKDYKPRKKPL